MAFADRTSMESISEHQAGAWSNGALSALPTKMIEVDSPRDISSASNCRQPVAVLKDICHRSTYQSCGESAGDPPILEEHSPTSVTIDLDDSDTVCSGELDDSPGTGAWTEATSEFRVESTVDPSQAVACTDPKVSDEVVQQKVTENGEAEKSDLLRVSYSSADDHQGSAPFAGSSEITEESVKKPGEHHLADDADSNASAERQHIDENTVTSDGRSGTEVAEVSSKISELCEGSRSSGEGSGSDSVKSRLDESLSDDSVICLDNDCSNSGNKDGMDLSEHSLNATKSALENSEPAPGPQSLNPGPASVLPVFPKATLASSFVPSYVKPRILAEMTDGKDLNSNVNQLFKSISLVSAGGGATQQALIPKRTSPRPMAKMLSDIGIQLVMRRLNENLIARQKRKFRKSLGKRRKVGTLDKLIDVIVDPGSTDHLQLKMENCSCGFVTESANVLELHVECGRESSGLQNCCLCEDYGARYSSQFVRHMESDHGRKVKAPVKAATYSCQLCPFSTNGRAVYEKHIKQCERQFLLRSNLKPNTSDCDIPLERIEFEMTKISRPVEAGHKLTPASVKKTFPAANVNCSKPSVLASEPAQSKNILRIGDQLFIVIPPTTTDKMSASVLSKAPECLVSAVGANRPSHPLTKVLLAGTSRGCGQPTNFVKLSNATPTMSATTSALLATSVLPLPVQSVMSSSTLSKSSASLPFSLLQSKPSALKVTTSSYNATGNFAKLVLPNNRQSQPLGVFASNPVAQRFLRQDGDKLRPNVLANSVARFNSVTLRFPPKNLSITPSVLSVPSRISVPPSAVVPSRISVPPSAVVPKSILKPEISTQPNGYVICPLCRGFVRDIQALDVHMRVAHQSSTDRTLFKCMHCVPVKWFSTSDSLLTHQRRSHGDSPKNVCPHCQDTAISDILAHVNDKHNVTLLEMFNSRFCYLCRLHLASAWSFENHMVMRHGHLFPNLTCLRNKIYSSGTKTSQNSCDKKDEGLGKPLLTLREMVEKHFCVFCVSHFRDVISFEGHMLQVHKDRFPSCDTLWEKICADLKIEDEHDGFGFCGTFRCPVCDDEFVSASYRYRHQMISHRNDLFSCSLCGKLQVTRRVLMRHLRLSHARPCSVRVERLDPKTIEKYNPNGLDGFFHDSSSEESIDLRTSPETVVITDEEDTEEKENEPLPKKPRIASETVRDGSRVGLPENIEEVLEIDGETIIIVQERDD